MTEEKSIHQELQELRLEVQNLKSEQSTEVTKTSLETTIKDFLEKDNINELFETIKKDYENISPITAIGLFTLGAIFARSLSSK